MKEEITKIKSKVIKTLKENEVKKAGVFGSYATGKVKEGSDIDILIEFKGDKTLLDFVGLKQELEKILRKKVDLLTYKSIHKLLRN
jgi:predicted nucleotidyltransferase